MRRRLTMAAGIAVGVAAAWFALRDLRLSELKAVLAAIGPATAFVFVPQVVAIGLDTLGWQWLLRRLGDVVGFSRLFRARVAAEFISIALPAGVLMADGMLSVVLTRWCGVRSPDAVAAVATRKLMIWRAHAIALLLAAVGVLLGWGSAVRGNRSVAVLLLVTAAVVGGISVLLTLLAGSGRPAERVRGLLLRVPVLRLRAALVEAESHFHATDARLARAARTPAVRAQLLYVAAWMGRAAEPWLILRLAGARLSFMDVLAAEALVGVVRSAAVLVPAGLGVQELGYAMFLRATGAPDPAVLTAALALLRRVREAAWATAGYVLLWKQPVPLVPVEAAPAEEPS